ncbi:flagellar M-ring protein FliF C-terminal domain-containing protein [Acidisoma silvae]|uniref:Flagellar M-ring protein FliF n=1 Tax=Acidisoma silvae TaxID=2802396 RepID=A0A963YQ77_9PROT|nr:flagellar M-ring protein FliF C-terminal domain-containing protein [Acidisoma silvae]MCB8874912.1 hypothetical protein [Acidisoma silvae]
MRDWRKIVERMRGFAGRLPMMVWLGAVAVALALACVLYLETSAPPFVALYDGLSPADGGKIIAALQKLGIPYQLQAAGNVILVPQPLLASARLQLGAQQLPASGAANAWDKLESAPMTATDGAQAAMATQALQTALQQSIESLSGVRSAQVFIAQPKDTPFLADQPKPSASVIIEADMADAQAVAPAIPPLIAGAVPGLDVGQITVSTTTGLRLYPASANPSDKLTQFATIGQIEALASAQVSRLLGPVLGHDHFRVAVSADVDFTRMTTHQVLYGPDQMIDRTEKTQTTQTGASAGTSAFGIPGALSNEPPAATTAATAPPPTPGAAGSAPAPATDATPASTAPAPLPLPQKTSNGANETYLTDRRESDVTPPDWFVKGLAVSVVIDKAGLGSTDRAAIQAALAGAFSYPHVAVTVLALPFTQARAAGPPLMLQEAIGPLSHAVLEVLGAIALLFGLALPMGRRIGTLALIRRPLTLTAMSADLAAAAAAPPTPALPRRVEYTSLREEAARNVPAVARLLQTWVAENE